VHESDGTAMRLMLLRHAKSEKTEAGQPDRERHLNARGHGDAPVIGAYMAHHALIPDLALVSPSTRTRETWERIVAELASRPREKFDERLYNANRAAILAAIKETAPKMGTLMVVGHNPGMHDVARHLIASGDVEARERLNEGLPTSGLVVIDFAGDDWRKLHARGGRLAHFITPRSLAAAARV
jgi:phosphohistidine phosphatase